MRVVKMEGIFILSFHEWGPVNRSGAEVSPARER